MVKKAAGQNFCYLGSTDKVTGWVMGGKRESWTWSPILQTYRNTGTAAAVGEQ